MASKRRSGFRPPELRGTLGTLLRTTTGVVRDALERGAREGRARLDDVRANRRRHDALAELGELVLDLIRRGEIDLEELPEARDLVQHLDDIDAADADASPRPAQRNRFDDRDDDRPRAEARPRTAGSVGPWSRPAARGPVDDERPIGRRHGHPDDEERIGHRDDEETLDGFHRRSARDTDADGTVSSGAVPRRTTAGRDSGPHAVSADAASRATRPTTPARPLAAEPASARAPTKPIKSLTRPGSESGTRRPESESGRRPDSEPGAAATGAESSTSRSRFPPTPHRKGGISFDDDDADLADYMHPDDVPAKATPKDGDHDA